MSKILLQHNKMASMEVTASLEVQTRISLGEFPARFLSMEGCRISKRACCYLSIVRQYPLSCMATTLSACMEAKCRSYVPTEH